MSARKKSPWESLYSAAAEIIPPCAIQQLLTFEHEIDITAFKAVNIQVFEWDQDLSILKTPLKNSENPEIWVGKNQILFRVSHALMDGRASLIWIRQVFKTLRGEPLESLDNRLTAQDLVTHVKQSGTAQFKNITNNKNYFFQTKVIKNARSNLLAKIAARIPEYFDLDIARIMIPVDLRRYVPEITHMGNLSAPIFLDVSKNNSWQEVQQQILSKLGDKQELKQDLSWDPLLKHAPCFVIKAILNLMLKRQDYMASAIISNLGKINLADFSTPEIKALSFRIYPVHTGLIPLSITLVDCGTHTEIALVCSEGPELRQKAEAFLDDLGGILDFFETRVRKTPHQIAVVCGNRKLTYQELDQAASNPLKNNHLVSFSLPRTEKALITLLQALKSGAAYLPIDPDYPKERRDFILKDSEICSNKPNLAYVLYTSGSTGQPKGVMVGHESLANYLLWARDFYQISSDTRFGLFTSLSFDLSVTSLFLSLLFGNGVEIFPGVFDFEQIHKIINSKNTNALKLTPTHLEYLCRFQIPADKFKHVIVGGEQFTTNLAQKAQKLLGSTCQIYNEYGPTEATVGCVAHRYTNSDNSLVVPIGKPIRGAKIHLINSEIHISGNCLALGYANQAELTNQDLAYQTGDLAHEENGVLVYDGRIDEQLKIRGFRVEPAEIEEAILSHTQVQQAKVFGQDQMLMAYYVSTSQLDDLFLKAYLRQKLPSHLVPHRLECVAEIPITISGKIAKILNSDLCDDSLKILELIAELSATHTMSEEDIQAIIQSPTLRTLNRIGLS